MAFLVRACRAPRPWVRACRPARRHLALSKLVDQGLDDEALKGAFAELSGGKDGIPNSELSTKLAGAYGFGARDPRSFVTKLKMMWLVRDLDGNSDNVISWDEFRSGVRAAEASALESAFFSPEALEILGIGSFEDSALRAAFDAVDVDRSGELDRDELAKLFLSVCPSLGASPAFQEMIDRVVEGLDADGNKAVSWEEFKSCFAVYQLTYMHRAALTGGGN